MAWKIFAIFIITLTIVGYGITRSQPASWWGSFETIMSVASSIVIYGYAFKRQPFRTQTVKSFSWLFSAYVAWQTIQSVVSLYSSHAAGKSSLLIAGAAFAIMSAMTFFEWLAVWRYGRNAEFAQEIRRRKLAKSALRG